MALNKWIPTTNLMMLRRMGKLLEELGEAQAVAARVIIQGIDEVDPQSGKVNRLRLQEELADVQAQIGCSVIALDLDQDFMARRTAHKVQLMGEWEAMFALDANVSVQQLAIALGKVHAGYKPGDEGWTPLDDQALAFALGAKS